MNDEHVTLRVGDADLEVVHLVAHEEVSRLFRIDVTCRGASDADAVGLRGATATVTLRDGAGNQRALVGLVATARVRRSRADDVQIELTIRPPAYRITLGRDCYVLHDVDVLGVVRDVLAEYEGPVAYRISRKYRMRDYVAQYREDDWSFLSRLLEEEGIHHFDDAGTLTFADDSRAADDLEGGAYIRYRASSGMSADEEHIDELGAVARTGPGRFVVGSFNPWKPQLVVDGRAGGSGPEIYDAPGGGPESPEDCQRRAEVLAEAAACAARTVRGATSSVRLVPGRCFEVGEHPIARLDGRYFITSVRTEVVQRRRGDGAGPATIHASFAAIPADLPFRPQEVTAPAKQAGLQTGVVVGAPGTEVHPDPTGRIRVQLHWDRGGARNDRSGRWMRVAQRSSAESMLLPRVGWNVASFNEEGTADAPRIISRLCDAEHPPPYALPENKTRTTYKTATTPGGGSFNEIHFEDRLGQEVMFIHASRDMTTLVKNGKTENILRDAFRAVAVNRDLTVGTTLSQTVGRDQTIEIGGNESVTAEGSTITSVSGDETITIAGKRSIKAGDHKLTVQKTRAVNVGAAQIDVTLGNLGAVAGKDTSTTVGGVVVRVAKDAIQENSKVGVQTIGGARIEITKARRTANAELALVTTVGGAMIIRCGDDYAESAQTKLTWMVGASFEGEAETVRIEATKQIVLRCGGSSVTIKPESVAISTPKFDLTRAAHLEVRTSLIEHN